MSKTVGFYSQYYHIIQCSSVCAELVQAGLEAWHMNTEQATPWEWTVLLMHQRRWAAGGMVQIVWLFKAWTIIIIIVISTEGQKK